jgi:hypothetical protein
MLKLVSSLKMKVYRLEWNINDDKGTKLSLVFFILQSQFWYIPNYDWGAVVVEIAWYVDLQLHIQSVPITTNVSLNPAHNEVYSIQHYVNVTVSWIIFLSWKYDIYTSLNYDVPIQLDCSRIGVLWCLTPLYVYIHIQIYYKYLIYNVNRVCPGCDCMIVGFTTTYAISAYHH